MKAAVARDRSFGAAAPASSFATVLRTPVAPSTPSRAAASPSEQASQSDSFAQRASGAAFAFTSATARADALATPSAKRARTRERGRKISGCDGRGLAGAEDMRFMTSGSTAAAAPNLLPSAGQAQACLADMPAAPRSAGASRQTTHLQITPVSRATPPGERVRSGGTAVQAAAEPTGTDRLVQPKGIK
jgi:hypothetical protein